MKIFSDIQAVPRDAKDAVIVIGNFDGMHKGHQALIAKGEEVAKNEGKALAVLTFEPHPRRLFRPDDLPNRITPPALKAERIEKAGVDILFSLPFNWDFASQGADEFVKTILIGGLGASHVVIGDDFHFGQMRKGSAETIEAMGLPVTVIEKIQGKAAGQGDEIISSSIIRHALRQGEITRANALLGWEWEIRGEVVKGDQRGRKLGYPTANVPMGDTVHPAYGVYATWARIEGEDEWHPSATNIGIRPMFEIPTAQVETYIFDFDRDIYGKTLCVKPVKRLRSEAKFESLEELITQIKEDCENAADVLAL